jgi:hypothetical protein
MEQWRNEMWLKRNVVEAVDNLHVHVFYVNWKAACQWNASRNDSNVPLVFTGWYWAKGLQEAGPFKSKSAAYRDVWYVLVVKRPGPRLHKPQIRRVA